MSLIFASTRCVRPLGGPPSSLAVDLRPTGPFWQDAARTVAAAVGDPVRVWDDVSGNGRHAVAASDAVRPLRAAGGGVDWTAATPTALIVTWTYTGVISVYYRGTRDATGDDEFMVSDAAGSDNFYVRANGDNNYSKIAGSNDCLRAGWPTSDTVASFVVNGAGAASWCGIGTGKTTTTAGTLSSASFTNLRLGAYNTVPSLSAHGVSKAVAIAAAGHNDAQWTAMVGWQAAL